MNLSQNFTLQELIHSDTANAYKINNTPSEPVINNLKALCLNVLQPLRDKLGKPMIITSGYRNSQVNKLVGGASNSGHLTGQAADFIVKGMTPAQVVEFIKKSGVKFTQLIEEYNLNTSWTHVSYNKNDLKCEVLCYKNGIYTKI